MGQRFYGDRRGLDGIGQQLDRARHGQQRRRPLERRCGRLGRFGAAGRERRGGHAGHRRRERE
ncbi:cell surface protein, partial [Burkholderia cenocepacia]|nr:cell surface protein [Burkholderia cenocepacia]